MTRITKGEGVRDGGGERWERGGRRKEIREEWEREREVSGRKVERERGQESGREEETEGRLVGRGEKRGNEGRGEREREERGRGEERGEKE